MEDFKNNKVLPIVKQFTAGGDRYEINGIDLSKAIFFYKLEYEKFKLIPKGSYTVITEGGNTYLVIQDTVLLAEAVEYQICYEFTLNSSSYDDDFPDIAILKEKYNEVVEDLKTMVLTFGKQGFNLDDITGHSVLPKLIDNTFWYMEDGEVKLRQFEYLDSKYLKLIEEAIIPMMKEELDKYHDAIINGAGGAFVSKVINIAALESSTRFKLGDVVEVLGYYEAGDGAGHKRKISSTDDGSGVQLANGLWANVVHNGEVNVSWFGAKGDGVTDDTDCIQKAINFSTCVNFMKKHKIVSAINIDSDLTMLSDSTEIIATKVDKGIFKVLEGCKFIQAKGFVFDANMQNFPLYTQSEYDSNTYYSIFWFNGFSGVLDISNNIFKNLYNHYIYFYQCNPNGKISSNKMSSPLQNQGLRADYISSVTCNGAYNLEITGNYCENEIYSDPQFGICFAIFAHCYGKTTIKDNFFNCFGRDNTHSHRLLTIDLYTDCTNVTIENNEFLRNTWGAVRIEESENVRVTKNKFGTLYNVNKVITEPFIPIYSGSRRAVRDIDISDNTFLINGDKGILDVMLVYGNQTTTNINIENNFINGKYRFAVNVDEGISVSRLNILNNTFNSSGAINIKTTKPISNVSISGNSFLETSSINPIHLEFTQSSDVSIFNNKFRWLGSRANVSIRTIGVKGVVVFGNTSYNFGGFIDATDSSDIMMYNNNVFANYNVYKDDSSSAIVLNNILNGGLTQTLDTPYYATKMQQEGIYDDYIAYRDELHVYEQEQKLIEQQRQEAYQQALAENLELSYEDWLSTQPMQMFIQREPQPTEELVAFKEKWLG